MTGLISLCFRTFSIVFPKTALFTSLQKSFSSSFIVFSLRLVFKSIYVFSQAVWLDLITLWTFFKINDLMLVLNFFYLTYSVFSILIIPGKNGKSLWSSCLFISILNINFEKISFIKFFIIVFFIKSSLNWEVSLIHSKLFYWMRLRHFPTI